MKFTVTWGSQADAELIRRWTSADSTGRAAITAATKQIDRILQTSPETAGESRGNLARRILFVPPLVVNYQVRLPDQLVLVLSILIKNYDV